MRILGFYLGNSRIYFFTINSSRRCKGPFENRNTWKNTCNVSYFVIYSTMLMGIDGNKWSWRINGLGTKMTKFFKPTYMMMCCCMAMCRLRGGGGPPMWRIIWQLGATGQPTAMKKITKAVGFLFYKFGGSKWIRSRIQETLWMMPLSRT